MGKLCIVINCSEELDHKVGWWSPTMEYDIYARTSCFQMMGRFHSGMCQSGIWCCFDEFNRINVEVLSVIAQQLVTIKAAKDSLCSRYFAIIDIYWSLLYCCGLGSYLKARRSTLCPPVLPL